MQFSAIALLQEFLTAPSHFGGGLGRRARNPGKARLDRKLLRLEPLEHRHLLSVGSIAGAVFEDLNANGSQDVGEPGLDGMTVYLDRNQNGLRDVGESFMTTDNGGLYSFGGLDPGTYTVAQELSVEWMQTFPTPATGPGLLWEVTQEILAPASGPRGLAWDGEYLYSLSGEDRQIYRLDPRTGAVLSQFPAPGDQMGYIGFDGTDFWGADNTNDLVLRFDSSGNVLQSFATPGTGPTTGVAWDGYSLWVADMTSDTIYELDPLDGTTRSSFVAPDSEVRGLTFDGTHLWTNGRDSYRTYELDPNTGEVLRSFVPPESDSGTIADLAYDGESMWIVQYTDGIIFRCDLGLPGTYAVPITAAGETITAQDFGDFRLGSISGVVFEDTDANGIRDDGESGLEGWRVYLDQNASGAYEPFEKTAVTDADGSYAITRLRPGDYTVAEVVRAPGWNATTATTVAATIDISGKVMNVIDFGAQSAGFGPLGTELLMNATTDGRQDSSKYTVATDSQGNCVVVWEGNGPGDDAGVFARRFDAHGQPLGSEILVNTTTLGTQYSPLVAMADDGSRFAVTWGLDYGIFARVFDGNGEPLGDEFQILAGDYYNQKHAVSIAMDADGDFLVGYSSEVQRQMGHDLLFCVQRFDSSGQRLGKVITIRPGGSITHVGGAVDMAPDGSFVIAWSEAGRNAYPQDVYAQRYDSSGNAAGTKIHVADDSKWFGRVAVDAQGGFVVLWLGDYFVQGFGQAYHADGTPRGDRFTYEYAESWVIDIGPEGDFVLAWHRSSGGYFADVYAQRFRADGTALDSTPFLVNTTIGQDQLNPSVAVADNGDFVIVWDGAGPGDDQGIFTQRYVASPLPPSLSIDDVSVAEGDNGTVRVEFTVTLSEPSAGPVTVQYATADASATAASDYVAASGTLTFDGVTSQMISVTVIGDTLVEDDETFLVRLSNPTGGAVISDAEGICTIVDDDAQSNTFESQDVPKRIVDPHPKKGPTPVTSVLPITSSGITVSLIDVDVTIAHASMSDLTVTLKSPSNATTALLYDGADWNLVEAAAFNGQPLDGTWVLTMTDTVKNGILGTLTAWSMTVTALNGGAASQGETLTAADLFFLDFALKSEKDKDNTDLLATETADELTLLLFTE